MAEKQYGVKRCGQGQNVTNLKKFAILNVASISDEDYVIVSQLANIDIAKVIDLETAAEYACTISDSNKITIDLAAGATNDNVLIVAVG